MNDDDVMRCASDGEDSGNLEEIHPVQKKSLIHESLKTFAGVAGNVLEWYDFAVFGFFSDILGVVFFPKDQPEDLSVMESFLVFGCAFFMRPVGGVIIGYIGDVSGRKKALEISLFLMAGATTLMGCLPTYDQIGNGAILLLLIVRMLQGLSVGGQLMSSLVFTVEGHPESKWGLYGSCVMAAGNFGTFLGGVTAYELRSRLTEAQLIQWGWRIPFLSGIFISICGVYLKYFCEDDEVLPGHAPVPTDDVMPENTDDNDDGELVEIINDDIANARPQPVNPLREAFSRENRRSLVATAFVPMVWSGGFYISFVWMAIFMQDLVHPPVPSAFGINSWSLLLLGLWFPVAGLLSDFFGRKRIMTIGGVSFGLLGPIMILLIGKKGNQSSWIAFLCQTVLGISLAFWGAPMCAWLVESFEPQARLTSVSIGYNISQALAGGMSPFFATLLVDKVGLGGPGILLFVLAIVSMTGLWVIAPSRRDHGMLLITASEIQEDNIIMEERSHSGLELKEIS